MEIFLSNPTMAETPLFLGIQCFPNFPPVPAEGGTAPPLGIQDLQKFFSVPAEGGTPPSSEL